jgi:hypothetical protein
MALINLSRGLYTYFHCPGPWIEVDPDYQEREVSQFHYKNVKVTLGHARDLDKRYAFILRVYGNQRLLGVTLESTKTELVDTFFQWWRPSREPWGPVPEEEILLWIDRVFAEEALWR